jgi:hypothetical protein
MGLDAPVLKMLKAGCGALACSTPIPKPHPLVTRVVLDDYLIRWRSIPSAPGTFYTLLELFWRFWGPVRQSEGLYVMICDDKSNVTKSKVRTQLARIAQVVAAEEKKGIDAPEPYPEGWMLVPEGILLPSGEGVPEPIELRRLAMSKPGTKVWEAFLPLIEEQLRRYPRDFIFDFSRDRGPVVFSRDGSINHDQYAHKLGEGEAAMIWWIRTLLEEKKTIVKKRKREDESVPEFHLVTTDSDMIPLYALYAYKHRSRVAPTYWHRGDEGTCVDMNAMLDAVKEQWPGTTLRQFSVACMLGGDDFMDRSAYSKGLGATKVFEAVMSLSTLDLLGVRTALDLMVLMLHRLYTRHIYATMDVKVPDFFAKFLPRPTLSWQAVRRIVTEGCGSSLAFPSDEVVRYWANELEVDYLYRFNADIES